MRRYPGPRSTAMLAELTGYVIAAPQPFVLDLERCEGMWLGTVDGQRVFDWAGYYGSKLLGHNHPRLYEPEYVTALARAANNKVANPDFLTPECLAYYRLLHELAPKCMQNDCLEVYTVNSGAEAVENVMKYLINRRRQQRGGVEAGRGRFVYFDQAFHGRTVFALNVTQLRHDPIITRDFHGFVEGNVQMPFPALDTDEPPSCAAERSDRALALIEACLREHAEEVVGVIVEPLQGAGGHRLAPKEFYQGLSRLTHEYGVYLGFDEVQTAGGQTGTFFAVDQLDLPYPPDAVAAAKKLGCGCVYMYCPMDDRGVLDSTWGGTLADMVRFVQEMTVVREERLIEQVPEKAERLTARLCDLRRAHAGVMCNVRGMGLYQGFSLCEPTHKRALQEVALETEDLLLLGAATDTIRLRPPLTVTADEIDLFAEKLGRALGRLGFAAPAA